MYKYILQSVENINWLAIIPLLIFFLFFLVVSIRTMKHSRQYVDHMGMLPLEDESLKSN